VFRRRRRDAETELADDPAIDKNGIDDGATDRGEDDGTGTGSAGGAAAGTVGRGSLRTGGPWDLAEVDDPAAGGRVNLGGMWLPSRPDLEVRVEADQATSQVVAVTLVLGDGALQVQPFAAPRTEPIWGEIRDEIRSGVTAQGGTADEVDGPLGPELRTRVPVRAADGSSGVQPARFVGVDGPRWFLRGVITGRPAAEEGADAALVELFRDIVVVRGDGPMAPREPIPLVLPAIAGAGQPAAADDPAADGDSVDGGRDSGRDAPGRADDLAPFERGPEITEIR